MKKNIWDYKFSELSKNVSLVKQNPLDQLVTFSVRDEIAFGLENLHYPKQTIENKVEEIARIMGIYDLLDRDIEYLSGGQKQLTILCSFLVMEPKILILDEPIAFLDQKSESLLLDRLNKLISSKTFNLTLIIIEHRLSRVINIADRIIILDENGGIYLQGETQGILREKFEMLKSSNVRVPWIIDIFNKFKIHREKVGNFENPSNFQNLLEILEKIDRKDLIDFRKILVDSEINPKHLEKYKDIEKLLVNFLIKMVKKNPLMPKVFLQEFYNMK